MGAAERGVRPGRQDAFERLQHAPRAVVAARTSRHRADRDAVPECGAWMKRPFADVQADVAEAVEEDEVAGHQPTRETGRPRPNSANELCGSATPKGR